MSNNNANELFTDHAPANNIKSHATALEFGELIHILLTKIGPLYQIDCIGLTLYDENITGIATVYTSEIDQQTNKIISHVIDDQREFDAITKEISGFQFPVIKSKKEWIDEFGENHCLTKNADIYIHHCYIPLEKNNKILGTLCVHNLTKNLSSEGLVFCSNIADILTEGVDLIRAKPIQINPVKAEHAASKEKNQDMLLSQAYEQIKQQLEEIKAYKEKLEEDKIYVTEELDETVNYGEIIGKSAEMKVVFNLLSQVAGSETTVLILGETGTGKELIARALHNNSARKNNEMIKVNCAAIPANLIESELFGHEKGAFTGATERRLGKFELADNSTIFLDEIGELPMDLQVKLLRVLQEKEFERVGGRVTLRTDVRVISATNRNLQDEVEAGNFRGDLFYRLNVFPVKLPALRERKSDLPLLAEYFLNIYCIKTGKSISGFSNKAIQRLKSHHWPGNVRELEHLIERHVLLTKGQLIAEIRISSTGKMISTGTNEQKTLKTLFENEREYIFSVLQHCNGRVSGPDGAAKILGLPATTLNSKIKKLGLTKTHLA